MENRYYTPEIEEFCVGFEYEAESTRYPDKNNWHPETFYLNQSHLNLVNRNTLYEKKVRIKYLDREDIESLGFKVHFQALSEEKKPTPATVFRNILKTPREENSVIEICHIPFTNWVLITIEKKTVFAGELKNKSELINQLKRCKIEIK